MEGDHRRSSLSSQWSENLARRQRQKTGSEILHLLSKAAKAESPSSVTTTTSGVTSKASRIQLVRESQEDTIQQRKRPRIRLEFDSPEQQRVRTIEKLEDFKTRYDSLRRIETAVNRPNFNFAFRHRREDRNRHFANTNDRMSNITYKTDTNFSLFSASSSQRSQHDDIASVVSANDISVDLRGWSPPLDSMMEQEAVDVETQPSVSSLKSEQQEKLPEKQSIRFVKSMDMDSVRMDEISQEVERTKTLLPDESNKKSLDIGRSEELSPETAADKGTQLIVSIDKEKQIMSPPKQDVRTQPDTQPMGDFDDAFYDMPNDDFGNYEIEQSGRFELEKSPSVPALGSIAGAADNSMAMDNEMNDDVVLEDAAQGNLNVQMEHFTLPRRVPPGDTFISRKIREEREAVQQGRTMETSGRHYPIRPVKKLFSAFTSMKQESGVEKRLQEASNLFFEQLADDVAAYADHAHRKTVTAEDIILLMKRQGLLTEQTSLEALAHEYLPREMWDSICVSALAHNELYPAVVEEEE